MMMQFYGSDGDDTVTTSDKSTSNRETSKPMRRQGHAHDRAAPHHRARAVGRRTIIPTSRSCTAAAPRSTTAFRSRPSIAPSSLFEDAGIIERHDFRDGRARYEQMRETITTISSICAPAK